MAEKEKIFKGEDAEAIKRGRSDTTGLSSKISKSIVNNKA